MFEPTEEEILFNHYYKINYNSLSSVSSKFLSSARFMANCKAKNYIATVKK
jgi:hypothetical protein